MGYIYEGAHCNIAATGFADGRYGLFSDRNFQNILPIVGSVLVPVSLNSNVVFPTGEFVLVDYDLWTNGIKQEPLNQRAWVVQERLLAPRTLHFTYEQHTGSAANRPPARLILLVFLQGLTYRS